MYITIDESDRRPIYRQVADEIKGLIARGELREGMALPPVRQVADDLGINLNTIAAAYRELQREGLTLGGAATVLPEPDPLPPPVDPPEPHPPEEPPDPLEPP